MSLDCTLYNKQISEARARGRADALELRGRAAGLDGTGMIAEERKIPVFAPDKDYSGWPAGSPVRELVDGEYQVFRLLQPHNAAHYPGSTPANTPALWSVCHTKDPGKAKSYLAPNGTSGMYMENEYCVIGGVFYKSISDNNVHSPLEHPENWTEVKGD